MKVFELENCKVILARQGSGTYTKASYPVRYGRYSEIDYGDFHYQFNNNGEVKYISGTGAEWPHPAEWLKRSIGNDWVYYSTGSYYTGVVDLFGEYYLPCPAYPTNTLFRENPFSLQGVASALREFEKIGPLAHRLSRGKNIAADKDLHEFLCLVGISTKNHLRRRGDRLHRILKARVSVLPPDCRHVDYDVVPLMITDGCLYNCSFCEIKSGIGLSCRSRDEIEEQLLALQQFFGPDLPNFNSIYLGQHDALCARPEDILFAANKAFEILALKKSYMQGPRLFLFGSAESFLCMSEQFWQGMNNLPFFTHVNIGLESFDGNTLEFLKKPVSPAMVENAFRRMLAINREYENIEVTANFLLGAELPAGHITKLLVHIGETIKGRVGKGCIYLSPLKGSEKTKKLLEQFKAIKQKSRFQTFLYLIQRL